MECKIKHPLGTQRNASDFINIWSKFDELMFKGNIPHSSSSVIVCCWKRKENRKHPPKMSYTSKKMTYPSK